MIPDAVDDAPKRIKAPKTASIARLTSTRPRNSSTPKFPTAMPVTAVAMLPSIVASSQLTAGATALLFGPSKSTFIGHEPR